MKHYLLSASDVTCPTSALCLAISMVLLSSTLPAQSQSSTFLGLELRLHDVTHTGGFRTLNEPSAPLFENGKGFGQSLGLKFQHHISSAWSFSGTIAYNRLPGLFEVDFHNPSSDFFAIELIESSSPIIDTAERNFSMKSEVGYTTLSLDLLAEWRPFMKESKWSIGIAAGPTFGVVLDGTFRQTANITSPANVRFVNNAQYPTENVGRTLFLYDGDIPEKNSTRIGIRAGLFAEFGKLDSGIVISPGIFYDLGLTNVVSSEDWKVNMLTGQLSVMIGL